jgi:hypothetical protein
VNSLKTIFNQAIADYRSIAFVVLMAVVVVFMPQVPPGDWYLNAEPLTTGLGIYANPNYVYPPWSLILLWPYYFLHVAGTRILFVLIAAFLAHRRGWPLSRFLLILLCPIFLYSLGYTNIDLIVLTLPIILWDYAAEKKWAFGLWGLLLAVMMLKPQGSILIIAYFFWQYRQRWKELFFASLIAALIMLPISLLGSPPLLLQWLDNIQHPSEQNQLFWTINNLSLNNQFGFIPAALIIGLSYAALYGLMTWRGKSWTKHHSWASLLFASMFLSPYTSLQSTIAAFAFAPSWPASLLQFLFVILGAMNKGAILFPQLWFFLLALFALWFAPNTSKEKSEDSISASLSSPSV